MKQEYLMLAQTFKPGKFSVAGWYVSEKLDGMRAYWDGGISRGIPSGLVPYANTVKNYRLKAEEIATGLWSRSGKVIHAPDDWLNKLPPFPLDGELFLGRGRFQELTSIVSKIIPGLEWNEVRFKVIDSPPFLSMFRDREIKVRSDYKFNIKDAVEWYKKQDNIPRNTSLTWNFEMVYSWLERRLPLEGVTELVEQERLSFDHSKAAIRINDKLNSLLDKGGEGVVFRKPESFWFPNRAYSLLKYKPWFSDEGVVIGYQYGLGKLEGLMGALILKLNNGKELKISGFTDQERNFNEKACNFDPGARAPDWVNHPLFPIGKIIEFKYRELSIDKIPKEARYYRKVS